MALNIMQICMSRGWGGLEMYPSRIMPELYRQGVTNHGVAIKGSRVATSMMEAGAQLFTVPSPTRAIYSLPRLLSYIDAHAIEILHCHKSSDLRVAFLLKLFRPGLKLFFTEHMGVTRSKKGLYHRFAYSQVTRVFSISQATYQRNLRALPLPSERIHCLGLGVDLGTYSAALISKAELGLPENRCLIALPGRITPGKGHEVWLDALAMLKQTTSWHALVIGGLNAAEGADELFVAEIKKKAAHLGLEDRVSFLGFRRDVPMLLQAMDIVCIPSRNEAFGLTVIESMAAGCAVVGANSGAIPELIDAERGRLADPLSVTEWVAAISELLNAPALRSKLGEQARQWVAENMTLDVHVSNLLREYRQD
ncbi:glycosyltransferase family 4 protein [Vreelandella nigrificans]|nr:glycosyltransferase family 4 protein [Halomonas nigrificans]